MRTFSVAINGARVGVLPGLSVREDADGIWQYNFANLQVLAHRMLVQENSTTPGRGRIDNVDLDLKEGLFRPPQPTSANLALVELSVTPSLEPIQWPKLCVNRGTSATKKIAAELLVMTVHEQFVLFPVLTQVLEWNGATLVARALSAEEQLNPAVDGLREIARLLEENSPAPSKMKEILFSIEQDAISLDLTRFSFVRAAAAIAGLFNDQHNGAAAAECYRTALQASYALPGEDSTTITRLRDYYVAQIDRLEKEVASAPTPPSAEVLAARFHSLREELKTARGERLTALSLELRTCNAQIAALNVSGHVKEQCDQLAAQDVTVARPPRAVAIPPKAPAASLAQSVDAVALPPGLDAAAVPPTVVAERTYRRRLHRRLGGQLGHRHIFDR